ncbi:Uncharacterized protein C1orf158 homolog [Geodia barretti]|uniref:Uncharacterized protein C1orf158 homolog n=1 Tax=Geodia barretti TaxID=519541 RepID=A0AA35X1I0_GEOBA|nr:Uncharacterized protein C1orf158 homolog [Geodia barretti]
MMTTTGGSRRGLGSMRGGKWEQPGWRIEQRFCQGVLIGNWSEDRLGKFPKGNEFGNSTSREAFLKYPHSVYIPDSGTRRKGVLRNYGLGQTHIFGHHGNAYMHNNISTYDQHFSRCHSTGQQREWDKHWLSWLPEASDHPTTGLPKRYGLKEAIEEKWRRIREIETHGDYHSTYSTTFRPPAASSEDKGRRYATPRHLSSHLHPHRGNAHLSLRGVSHLQAPETVDTRLLNATV